LDAAARARNAQVEMDEISGLRRQRDRVRQHLADVKQQSRKDSASRGVRQARAPIDPEGVKLGARGVL
jgi:hypothetical protein